ncbi:MAG: hypothetical protein ACLQMT_04615 [Candidatus Acidiferrales bacterium]
MPTRQDSRDAATIPSGSSLPRVLAGLFLRPQRILLLWNWKSAWLSVILRGPIFLAASIARGFGATVSAVLTECMFCAVAAGFYGAIVQNVRDATPPWLTALFVAVVLPAAFQALEFLLHLLRGTPHLRLAEIASASVSTISALFSWYAMRRGALLVGGEGCSFGSDLRRLPRLLLNFTLALPAQWAQSKKTAAASRDDSRRTGLPGSGAKGP